MKSKKFKEADEETRRIIYLLSDKTEENWIKEGIKYINEDVFNELECPHIIQLDELWTE